MCYFLAVPLIPRLKILTLKIKISLQRTVVGTCGNTIAPVHQIIFCFMRTGQQFRIPFYLQFYFNTFQSRKQNKCSGDFI